ncbi:glycosyltransferase family 4 protein [Candidatus Fermentibacterales bacterium]|nr:glycosyltransferase family 4 protein [Candidatus Fermentibacterales bacterium]
MRIALNVDFPLRMATGVSRFGMELARAIAATGHLAEAWLNRASREWAPEFRAMGATVRFYPFPRRLTDRFWPSAMARRNGIDAVLSPGGVMPASTGGAAHAVILHDMGPFILEDMKTDADTRAWRSRIHDAVRRASRILVNSVVTRRDLIGIYPNAEGRTVLVPPGIDHFHGEGRSGKMLHILAVGTLEPRKNYETLLEAYSILRASHPGMPPLVIAGMDGYRAERIRRLPSGLGLGSSVSFTGYVSEERLRELYRDAACLVHPALYEGFGFTVAEAFAWRLPVACSSAGALGEFFTGCAHMFDPLDAVGMSDAIATCLDSGVTPGQQGNRARLAADLTWESAAHRTIEALEEAL